MPIVRATNQTIVLMQPDKSPWYWKLKQSMDGFEQGGSNIYLWPLRGVRDRFYFRPDASAREQAKGKPFDILGVNMAENATKVTRFLKQRVQVKFPIVLDKDGSTLKAWRVFAFPTSFIIDKRGHIRYALFGGIDWNTPQVKHILAKLIAE